MSLLKLHSLEHLQLNVRVVLRLCNPACPRPGPPCKPDPSRGLLSARAGIVHATAVNGWKQQDIPGGVRFFLEELEEAPVARCNVSPKQEAKDHPTSQDGLILQHGCAHLLPPASTVWGGHHPDGDVWRGRKIYGSASSSCVGSRRFLPHASRVVIRPIGRHAQLRGCSRLLSLEANLEICTLDGCAPCFAAIRAKDGWHA